MLWGGGHSLLTLLLVLLLAGPAAAAPLRLALLVSHPEGGPPTVRLRYPEQDARKLAAALQELGGFAPAEVVLLRSPGAGEVLAALDGIERRLARAAAAGEPALFLFFYSGHAAADRDRGHRGRDGPGGAAAGGRGGHRGRPARRRDRRPRPGPRRPALPAGGPARRAG
ncbi:MAG: caspase family protein [Myxococcota bacterium]|nr:caspase family protein [Myxococcota bacterium]